MMLGDEDLTSAMFNLKTVMRGHEKEGVDFALQRIMYWSPYTNKRKLLKAAKQIKKEQKADQTIGKYWDPTYKTLEKTRL